MDVLLVLVAIGGAVVAIAMFVLASRAKRMDRESDERVEMLEVMATGSVLFASETPAAPATEREPVIEIDLPVAVETARALPFVLNVPAASGPGRVFSFDRQRNRS